MNLADIGFAEKDSCGTTKAAHLLQVSVGTVHQMVEKGELESWRTVGGHRRILMKSIREAQARRRIHLAEDVRRPSKLTAVVLTATVEHLLDIRSCLGGISSHELNASYFDNATTMMLNLPALRPHILVLDMESLPALGGRDWLHQLRLHEGYSRTRILLLCGKLAPEDAAAVAANKVEILRKPFSPAWLSGFLQALLGFPEVVTSG